MKIKTLRKRLVIAGAMGAFLWAIPKASTAENAAYPDSAGGRSAVTMRKLIPDQKERSGKSSKIALLPLAGAAVTEWNQHAVSLTLLPASNLAPVQQTRVMAIVQTAMFNRAPFDTLRDMIYTHPTMAEGLIGLLSDVEVKQNASTVKR